MPRLLLATVALSVVLSACDAPAPPIVPAAIGPVASAVPAPSPDEVAYVTAMVDHHRQGLRLVEVLRERGGVPYRISNLADHMAAIQKTEVTDMTDFLNAWGRRLPSAPMHMSEARIDALRTSAGAAAGRTFLQLMIAHHEGAVQMSTAVLPAARNPWVISLARHVIADQSAEIAAMRRAVQEPL
ncbi:DUF305 domain-containing protein [Actinoplanes sp. HUAS TT8]|uniref:DUF305 domain-containing protein n=1 Tax=Actinoplanes sp. HUAS TT8 TaxID=3447453 RepID=UPI003F521A42